MATYQDIHRIIKETIQVDAEPSKRWTPQKVKFINNENEFYGKFFGKIDATEFNVSNASLSNVNLSGCKIYDLSGNELDLNTIFPSVDAMNKRFDDISSEVYITIPNEIYIKLPNDIKAVGAYVNEVSSDISVLIDEKIAENEQQGQEGLEEEKKERKLNDEALSADIKDIRDKIKGGIIFKGMVFSHEGVTTTLSSLILTNAETEDDEVRNGFMYVVQGDDIVVEGDVKIDNGDYIYIDTNKKSFDSLKVKEVTKDVVDVLDTMDSKVYSLISEISADLFELSTYVNDLNFDKELVSDSTVSVITKIVQTKGQISVESKELVSSDITGLKDYVENEICLSVGNITSDIDIDEGKILTSIKQQDGVVAVETAPILSSYVEGLEDYVRNEIRLSVEDISSDIGEDGMFIVSTTQKNGKLTGTYSRVTDEYIDDETISKIKINGLVEDLKNISSEISAIDIKNRGDVFYMGDFSKYDYTDLREFLFHNLGEDWGYILKKGSLFRVDRDISLSCNSDKRTLVENDFMLVSTDVPVRMATFGSFRYIKDFQKQINNELFHLSGNNTANGDNVFNGDMTVHGNVNMDGDDVYIWSSRHSNISTDTLKVLGNSEFNGDALVDSSSLIFKDDGRNFKNIVTDLSGKIRVNRNDIQNLSNEVKGLSCENGLENGYILSFLEQSEGKVSYETTKLISSHVEGLEDYVRNEIGLSVENISSDIAVDEGKILTSIKQENGIIQVRTGSILSNYVDGLEDYVTSKISEHDQKIDGAYVHLSGGNSISGYNEFVGNLSADNISVSFDNVIDGCVDYVLSSRIKMLDDPKILGIVTRINEIITYSGIDVEKIEDITNTIVGDIKDRTIKIYQKAHETSEVPSIETFGDMKMSLNGVLGTLKMKGSGLSLATRLTELQDNIDTVEEYAEILNQDLNNLCVHVNLSAQGFREDIDTISSELTALDEDYHSLKDNTFHAFEESKGIDSMGLVVEDQQYNTETGKHDKYVMTFLSGTVVFEKI